MSDEQQGTPKYTPPSPDGGDALHTIARAGLSIVPAAGGPLVELLNTVIAPSLQKRTQRWMNDVAEGLRELEETGLKIEDLAGNEVFVDAVMQATEVARRTSNDVKREALRNAIMNAALPQAPGEALQQIFLNHIDRFGEWHIRILALADDPPAWFESRNQPFPDLIMAALQSILQRAFPELASEREFLDQVWADLYDSGLVTTDSLQGGMSASGLRARRTTDIGRKFLRFISRPVAAV